MAALGKPLVIEEFGKQLPVPANASVIAETRDPIFRAIYSALQNLENVKGSCLDSWCDTHPVQHVLVERCACKAVQ